MSYVSGQINFDQTNKAKMAVLLRIILLIGNASLLAFFVTVISDKHFTPDWRTYTLLIFLGVNFVYLLLGSDWRVRIFRLIRLWFDAKESELRQRANQSRKDE